MARARRKFELVDIARALAKSVALLKDGSPASPVGELIDVIVNEVEAANQSNSQGSANPDVPAEEDQAKEGAWELFTGWPKSKGGLRFWARLRGGYLLAHGHVSMVPSTLPSCPRS